MSTYGATLSKELPKDSLYLPKLPRETQYVNLGKQRKTVGIYLVSAKSKGSLGGGFGKEEADAPPSPTMASLTILVNDKAAVEARASRTALAKDGDDFGGRPMRVLIWEQPALQ